jgi:collagenase-like PrtC family protease
VRFAVGYQLPETDEPPFAGLVREFREHIEEVYFPWLDLPSGRAPITTRDGFVDWGAQARLEQDLADIAGQGVKLDLLLNASCYGAGATSQEFINAVLSLVAHLSDTVGLSAVTTMSPVLAQTVKHEFAGIDVRASVNMRLGTVKALEYAADRFDSYYVQREYNRDPERLAELHEWADAHGKRLFLLVNSGCLSFCAVQTFHDNVVSHEKELSGLRNARADSPAHCWSYYREPAHWVSFLQNSWVRPEDLHHYEDLFPVVKLATRMHARPRLVIEAYARGRFGGSLPDLLEPGHGPLFAPYIIDNTRFPADWFAQTTQCDKRCHRCEYCASVLAQVLVARDDPSLLGMLSV